MQPFHADARGIGTSIEKAQSPRLEGNKALTRAYIAACSTVHFRVWDADRGWLCPLYAK